MHKPVSQLPDPRLIASGCTSDKYSVCIWWHALLRSSQCLVCLHDVGVLHPQLLLPGAQCLLIEQAGLLKLPLRMVEPPQAIKRSRCLGMVLAQQALPRAQHPLIERFGLRVSLLKVIQGGQVVEGFNSVGMLRPQSLFADRQRALVQQLRLDIIALSATDERQVVERASRFGMLCSPGFLAN